MGKSLERKLNVIIVGCGKIGLALVAKLSAEGHDITVIDKNADRISLVSESYDVMGIVGNGAASGVLHDANIDETDVFIAVTEYDEINLLCCTVAGAINEKCATIARVRTPDYNDESGFFRDRLNLALIINPEYEMASEIARLLFMPMALDIDTFAEGRAELIRINVPDTNKMCGKSIANIAKEIDSSILICAVERNEEVTIPDGSFVIEGGDIISFIASRKNVKSFLSKVGLKTNSVGNCMIIGGGRSGFYLAKQLLNSGIDVKIIESDRERAERLSEELPGAVIINGDGTDESLLKEEGIEYMEAVVPLTGIDEENIMLTLHTQQVSNAKVITKITRTNFKNVINSMELGSVINPRDVASEAIVRYVRAKKESIDSNIESLYHLFDSKAEAIEFKIDKASEVTSVQLMDMKLKDNLRVALISRKGKVFIPKGADSIEVGDSVVIVTSHTGFNDITDIIKR